MSWLCYSARYRLPRRDLHPLDHHSVTTDYRPDPRRDFRRRHDAPSWDPSIYVIPEHAFAVQATEVTLCPEHDDVRWCSVREAMELLRFDSNRHALCELNERVAPGPRIKRTAYK